jgi:hypothetical protein
VVLSGGSVVSIYSDNAYQSYDLDFIQTGIAHRVDAAMERLDFDRLEAWSRHERAGEKFREFAVELRAHVSKASRVDERSA